MFGSYSEALMQEYINKRNAQIEAFKKFILGIDGPVYYTHFFDTKFKMDRRIPLQPGDWFFPIGKYLPPDPRKHLLNLSILRKML